MRGRETNVYTTMVASLLEKEGKKGKTVCPFSPFSLSPNAEPFGNRLRYLVETG
jgi:hypothetical protein